MRPKPLIPTFVAIENLLLELVDIADLRLCRHGTGRCNAVGSVRFVLAPGSVLPAAKAGLIGASAVQAISCQAPREAASACPRGIRGWRRRRWIRGSSDSRRPSVPRRLRS